VSQETEDILQKEMGLAVTRLQGENRYLTCLAIVRYFSSNPAEGAGKKYEKAALATGENYPDALAARRGSKNKFRS
jgi:putative cell wall-binding protein